ncbi:hypothetical protein EVAR_25320_1 [Eumeta japonica]|uniref:Uncharacterized protein n=1 Tax=Eumeta variegata TaxID=151549 RepID=A0A4C1VQ43_EUMVA|nr:hypothetical protein EVAR_25320_1 [Eumeta japonica]
MPLGACLRRTLTCSLQPTADARICSATTNLHRTECGFETIDGYRAYSQRGVGGGRAASRRGNPPHNCFRPPYPDSPVLIRDILIVSIFVAQIATLSECLEKYPRLVKGYSKTQNRRERVRRQWGRSGLRLRSAGGALKSAKQWLRNYERQKGSPIDNALEGYFGRSGRYVPRKITRPFCRLEGEKN